MDPRGRRSPGLISLGRSLVEDAPALGRQVLDRTRRLVEGYAADEQEEVAQDIVRVCTLATAATGHFMATGETATPAEWTQISWVGKVSADERISLADMTKLYLSWRDVALGAAQSRAQRMNIDDLSLHHAETAIRASCDASLVRTARMFDRRRAELHAELAEDRARLAYLARHDVLTGLPNRRTLFEELGQVVDACTAQRRGAAVLFVDLNDFKSVNDRAGHSTGDQLLAEVAGRLAQITRPGDMVARFGGDEFVVLCSQLGEPMSEAAAVASRIHEALVEPFIINGERHVVSASIGISEVGPDDDPEHLLSAADAAMYVAKQSNRAETQA